MTHPHNNSFGNLSTYAVISFIRVRTNVNNQLKISKCVKNNKVVVKQNASIQKMCFPLLKQAKIH